MTQTTLVRNAVIPALRYRDALVAIDWLCNVFGFQRHAVYAKPDGMVEHAQLTLEGGMLMLGSVRESEMSDVTAQPDETGGRSTCTLYLVSNRVQELYDRAKAAGAKIEREIKTESYGGEGFSCRDLEGHVWSVGSYDPWAQHEQ